MGGACDPHGSNQLGVVTLETSPAASLKKQCCLQDVGKKVAPNDYTVRCKGDGDGNVAALVTFAFVTFAFMLQLVTADTDSVAATDKNGWTNNQLAMAVIIACGVVIALLTACFLYHRKETNDERRHKEMIQQKKVDLDIQKEKEETRKKKEELRKEKEELRKKKEGFRKKKEKLREQEETIRNLKFKVESAFRQLKERVSLDTRSGLAGGICAADGSAVSPNSRQWEEQVVDKIPGGDGHPFDLETGLC